MKPEMFHLLAILCSRSTTCVGLISLFFQMKFNRKCFLAKMQLGTLQKYKDFSVTIEETPNICSFHDSKYPEILHVLRNSPENIKKSYFSIK